MTYSKGLKWMFGCAITAWIMVGIMGVLMLFNPIDVMALASVLAPAGILTGATWYQWEMEKIEGG